jgi:hypothetical protein
MNDTQVNKVGDKIGSHVNQDTMPAFMVAHTSDLQNLDINFGMCNLHNNFCEYLRPIADKAPSHTCQHYGDEETHEIY